MVKRSMPKVEDPEVARQILVARVTNFSAEYGYGDYIRQVIEHLELEDYVPTRRDRYMVKTEKLIAALGGDMFEVRTNLNRTPRHGGARDTAYAAVVTWADQLSEDDWIKQERPAKEFDTQAVLDTYGRQNKLSEATDEAKAVWQDLITKSLVWAEAHNVCPDFERYVTLLGFGEFLPPDRVNAKVSWGGLEVQVQVRADRQGKPRLDYLESAVLDALRKTEPVIEVVGPATTTEY